MHILLKKTKMLSVLINKSILLSLDKMNSDISTIHEMLYL